MWKENQQRSTLSRHQKVCSVCSVATRGGDLMKNLENAAAWCPYCDTRARIVATQPYRDYTWRVEFQCRKFGECDEAGVFMVMEVKE